MRIAIQASDLDHSRIDGTRVYILNLLKHFGKIDFQDDFLIYHKNEFNPELVPASFPNYQVIQKNGWPFWTQTRFALELWKTQPDVLWMPMQALPLIRRKNLKTVVTIHDLAFKIFPQHFPKNDLRRLNFLTDLAIRKSDKIIAVSQSTKKDILKFYPEINENKIRVIYHGFDAELFSKKISQEKFEEIAKNYQLKTKNYIIFVGAIQPRKNLTELIQAFEVFKKKTGLETKLVLAGEKAWLWQETEKLASQSPYNKDIIITGKLKFDDLSVLISNAGVYVLPSLYEGFGMPILEAFASKVPAILACNSSLPEVGGEAVLYFRNEEELAEMIEMVLSDEKLRACMIKKGAEQIKKFSWEKCAKETIEFIKL